jgi:site-specific DNA-adenine methylase
MEKVVNKLSEIEAAAVAIMDNANAKKKEISDNMNMKIVEFDKKVDAETADTLAELTQKLQTETEQELSELKTCTQKNLDTLEDEYNKNHSILANNIFRTIVRE